MKITILYPADYFDIKKVDADKMEAVRERIEESAEDRLNIGSLHFFHCFMGIRGRFSDPVRSGAASHHLFIGTVKG